MPDKVQVDIDERISNLNHIADGRILATKGEIKKLVVDTIESLKLPEKKEINPLNNMETVVEDSLDIQPLADRMLEIKESMGYNEAVDLMQTAKQNLIKEIQG